MWCQSCIHIKIWLSENWQADGGSVLGLATNKRHRLQQSNTLHLTVKTTLLTIHTATAPRILLTLKNTSYNISVPNVKCVVITVCNVRQTPNGILLNCFQFCLQVNQSGHFMLTSLFWMSPLWVFSKSTDWSLHDFVVIINLQSIKEEINPKNEKAYSWQSTWFLLCQMLTDIHSVYCWWKRVQVIWRCVVIFSRFWRPEWIWISGHQIRE